MAARLLLQIISAWIFTVVLAAAEPQIVIKTQIQNTSLLSAPAIAMPGFALDADPQHGCGELPRRSNLQDNSHQQQQQLKTSLRHRDSDRSNVNMSHKSRLLQSLKRDSARVGSFQQKISQNVLLRTNPEAHLASKSSSMIIDKSDLVAQSTVESGASLGAGEYLMDVMVGDPPQHFSLIIDTGSDLTWLQCTPCEDCYDQAGPLFDPGRSATFNPLSCNSPTCDLVTHYNCPAGSSEERSSNCKYLYSYGDSSQTSGDLALETLSINLSKEKDEKKTLEIREMVIGCGHKNKGLFQGAGGLIGLGQGPLSFSSQLKSTSIGHGFSYCLVDRRSNLSVSSVINFGDDLALSRHFNVMQYTPFVRTNTSVDTFYYLGVRGLRVGDETLPVSPSRFQIAENGSGGIIIDSGTTLTYLDSVVYHALESAFLKRITYPRADPFDVLGICYNCSGISERDVSFPALSVLFGNGAEMRLPHGNYFIQPDPDEPVHCLAVLPTAGLSIIGNFQQQNIHLLYDVENSRLGFAKTDCASL